VESSSRTAEILKQSSSHHYLSESDYQYNRKNSKNLTRTKKPQKTQKYVKKLQLTHKTLKKSQYTC
jgi:hypothetical protein